MRTTAPWIFLNGKCTETGGNMLLACIVDLKKLETDYRAIADEMVKRAKSSKGSPKCKAEGQRLYGVMKARAESSAADLKSKIAELEAPKPPKK